ATVSLSDDVPLSVVTIWIDAAPLKFEVGRKFKPFSAALMLASVPVKVIVPSAVPSPTVNDKPAVPLRVITPLAAVSVTVWLVSSTAETLVGKRVLDV